jgi:uncharacterized protein HemY
MGKLKALKGFGKAYEAFKKTIKAPETQTRNIESAKMFEKAKKTIKAPETQTRNIIKCLKKSHAKMFEKAKIKKK